MRTKISDNKFEGAGNKISRLIFCADLWEKSRLNDREIIIQLISDHRYDWRVNFLYNMERLIVQVRIHPWTWLFRRGKSKLPNEDPLEHRVKP